MVGGQRAAVPPKRVADGGEVRGGRGAVGGDVGGRALWRVEEATLVWAGGATAVGGGDGEGGGEAAATAEAEPAWTVEAEDVIGEVGVEPEMLLTGEDSQWLHEERTASRRSGSKRTLAERGVGKLTAGQRQTSPRRIPH